MGMFKKASAVQPYLKILAYGPPGSGKTRFALSFAADGPIAVIDTEGGTNLYGGMFDFDVLPTKSYAEIMRAITELKKPGCPYKTIVIDPITVIYENLQEAAHRLLELKAKDQTTAPGAMIDTNLSQREWNLVKLKYKNMMTDLTNLPMNVVIVSRQKDLVDRSGAVIGCKVDSEKSTDYIPDLVLHFLGDEEFTARVEKARGVLESLMHKTIKKPSYERFKDALVVLSERDVVSMQNDTQAADETAAILEANEPRKPAPTQPSQTTRQNLEQKAKGSTWEAAHISEEVLQVQEEYKKLSETLGIAPGRLTNEINKARTNVNVLDGAKEVLGWLNTPGIANMLWYSQLGIKQEQYLAYKKQAKKTDTEVYEFLKTGNNERAKLMNAIKTPSQPVSAQPANTNQEAMATDRQLTSIRKLCTALNQNLPNFENMTFNQAREMLTQLSHAYSEARPAS
jgi:hypothetical protein